MGVAGCVLSQGQAPTWGGAVWMEKRQPPAASRQQVGLPSPPSALLPGWTLATAARKLLGEKGRLAQGLCRGAQFRTRHSWPTVTPGNYRGCGEFMPACGTRGTSRLAYWSLTFCYEEGLLPLTPASFMGQQTAE